MQRQTLDRILSLFPHAEVIPGGVRFWSVDEADLSRSCAIEFSRGWIDQTSPQIVYRAFRRASREMGWK